MRLRLERVLGGLRRVGWGSVGARWAVLFGGLAARGWGRDVDLLVMPAGGVGPGWVLEVALAVGEALGLDPGLVDVVDARVAPCAVVRDAWRRGVVVYEEEPGGARRWLLARVRVCVDYELAARRLRVPETAARAAERRWGRGMTMTPVKWLLSEISLLTGKLDKLSASAPQGPAGRRLEGSEWGREALQTLRDHARAFRDLVIHLAQLMGYGSYFPREAVEFLSEKGLLTACEAHFALTVLRFLEIVSAEYRVNMNIIRRIIVQEQYRDVTSLAHRLVERARERGLDP